MFIYYDDKTLCHVLVFLFSNTKLHKPRKIEYSVCYELETKTEERTHHGPTVHRSGVLTTEILGDPWRMRSYLSTRSVVTRVLCTAKISNGASILSKSKFTN